MIHPNPPYPAPQTLTVNPQTCSSRGSGTPEMGVRRTVQGLGLRVDVVISKGLFHAPMWASSVAGKQSLGTADGKLPRLGP